MLRRSRRRSRSVSDLSASWNAWTLPSELPKLGVGKEKEKVQPAAEPQPQPQPQPLLPSQDDGRQTTQGAQTGTVWSKGGKEEGKGKGKAAWLQ